MVNNLSLGANNLQAEVAQVHIPISASIIGTTDAQIVTPEGNSSLPHIHKFSIEGNILVNSLYIFLHFEIFQQKIALFYFEL
jgi:hypothetical protein